MHRAPEAPRRPERRTVHGTRLDDDFAWLREREDEAVHEYLKAENEYTEAMMSEASDLQKTLYEEMIGRLKETDRSVPVPVDDYFYYSRTVEGLQYPIYCRCRGSADGPEEVLLDVNALADGNRYLRLGVFSVSPDHRLLAYAVDTSGAETYRLQVMDLERRQHLPDQIEPAGRGFVWANDSKAFYYTTLDSTRRPFRLHHHVLGSSESEDPVLFEETDERFFLSPYKTLSRRYLCIQLGSHTTSEIHYLDLEKNHAEFRCLAPRRQGVEMRLDHRQDKLYILSNENAPNFKLLHASVDDPRPESWSEVIAHRDDSSLEGIDLLSGHMVVYERCRGLGNIRVYDFEDDGWHDIAFDEPVYAVWGQDNRQFESQVLRFVHTSLVTPTSTYDYDLKSRGRKLLKVTEVLGGYDAERFQCERLWVPSQDGTEIPVSLVRPKDLPLDGSGPLLLYGYGSYGNCIDPYFSSSRLGLLERGFSFAIAHIRGGGEMGRCWYDDGKLAHKQHTFDDFIAVGEALIERGYTRSDRMVLRGGSAGGLLIGAVINQRPALAAAAIAEVPFVDVINTMLDPTLPLTVIEYEEWGNPQEKTSFETILAYSPYDNVAPQGYPHLLVTAGLNDPRVQYWEPAKWVAKLRRLKTDDNLLLLRTNMDSGHGGASGRYDALREEAFKQAFAIQSVTSWQDLTPSLDED